MVFLLALPVVATCILVIYACIIGGRAWMAADHVQGEAARALRFLTLNLCEPVIGIPLVLITLMLLKRTPDELHFPLNLLICWPMVLLLAPAFGLPMQQDVSARTTERITQLGAARIACNTICFGMLALTDRDGPLAWIAGALVLLLPFVSLWLLWHTARWARSMIPQLAPSYQVPGYQVPANPIAAASVSQRTTAPIQPLAVAQAEVRSDNRTAPCSECSARVANDAAICPQCGLVFASSIPSALRDLPRFSIQRALTEGGMSQIYLARDRAVGDWCVIKVANSADARRCLEREAWLLRDLRHRGVVSLLGWYPEAPLPFVALDYVPGPSLDQLLTAGPLPVRRALRYARSAAETLCHLAARPITIVHCDLKPGNLIVNPYDDSVILLDFGSAVELREPSQVHAGVAADHYGTPGYAAPELYGGNPTPRSDVYGLAATLYFLATGDDPGLHPLMFPAIRSLPADLAGALSQALAHDPAQRPSPFVFRDTLRQLAGRTEVLVQSSIVSAQRS